VAHDICSTVTTDSTAARPFVGGKIELAIADVSGDHYVDHERKSRFCDGASRAKHVAASS